MTTYSSFLWTLLENIYLNKYLQNIEAIILMAEKFSFQQLLDNWKM